MKAIYRKCLLAACVGAVAASSALPVSAGTGEVKKAEAPAEQLTDDQLGELFQQAFVLASFRRFDDAEKIGQRILAQRPDNPDVKKLLQSIAEARRRVEAENPGGELRERLSSMILPEVEFRAASVQTVIEYLQRESRKFSTDKTPVNFIWLVPAGVKVPAVTLSMRKIPLLDVVKYTVAAAGLACRVDSHAIVIFQPAPPEPPTEASPKPKSNVRSE